MTRARRGLILICDCDTFGPAFSASAAMTGAALWGRWGDASASSVVAEHSITDCADGNVNDPSHHTGGDDVEDEEEDTGRTGEWARLIAHARRHGLVLPAANLSDALGPVLS